MPDGQPTRWMLTAENTTAAILAAAVTATGALGPDSQPLTFPAEGARDPAWTYQDGEADYHILIPADPGNPILPPTWARKACNKLDLHGIRVRLYATGDTPKRYDYDLTDPDDAGLLIEDLTGAAEGCGSNSDPLHIVTDTGHAVRVLGVRRIGNGVEIVVAAGDPATLALLEIRELAARSRIATPDTRAQILTRIRELAG